MEQTHLDPLTSCPICGSSAFTPLFSVIDQSVSHESFSLTTCKGCGFCATNPRPAASRIGAYYESTNYISHTNTSTSLQDRAYQFVRRWAIQTKHKQIAKYKHQGKALDMGCGTGEFLAYLKRKGYSTQGIEPSGTAREQAIHNHTLDVVPDIDQIPANGQFEIITLWHVLEHIYDLNGTLDKLHARMMAGGLLVIAVPDRESWDAQYYRTNWAAYDAPRHLFHFRRRDMSRLLSDHGFQLVNTRRMWFDAAYVSILSERYRGAPQGVAMIKGIFMGLLSNLVAIFSSRPTSSSFYFAQKR
ncbi:MAG: class I SAM-dependent methyltransferase [Flavobacteriales bacterium]|nr:class I SAM-dependent methyltransferase [Flavobacteriales bacterium]